MGNTCGCADDKTKNGETSGSLNSNAPALAPFKIANFQSKISPTNFAGLTPAEKDLMLAEAFNILTNTVESSKITANNSHIKQLTAKTLGRATNGLGETYEGEIINGVANGKGKIKYQNGTVYDGDMFRGLRHGQGKITEVGLDARTYKSVFLDGNPLGPASMVSISKHPDSGKLEGGFDRQGKQSGPYLNLYDDGSLSYYTQIDEKPDGPHVFIAPDFKYVSLTEYKADKEIAGPTNYALVVESAKTAQPAHPAQPGQPAQPAQPGQPAHYAQPAQPAPKSQVGQTQEKQNPQASAIKA